MGASNPTQSPTEYTCLGDSISDPDFRSTSAWPYWLSYYLQNSSVHYDGVSGNDTAAVLARLHDGGIYTYVESPYFHVPNRTRGRCFFMIGVNDFIFVSATAAQAIANHTACCNYLVANGWLPILMTMLPFGNHTAWTAAMETNRGQLNTYIRGTTYKVIDLDPSMADLTIPAQPKLLSVFDGGDGLHPNVFGAKHIALKAALS